MTKINARDASVVYTPMDIRNQSHPTVGRCMVLPTAVVATALDRKAEPGDHLVVARPMQTIGYTEAMQILHNGEDDASKAMLSAFARLVLLDGLDAGMVGAMFASNLAGWREILADGRARGQQRMSR